MEIPQRREGVASAPPGGSAAWTAFWIAAGIAGTWPFWGAYLFLYAAGALDPLVMLAFSIPCAILISSERERHGTGVTPRTLECLVVFLTILAFMLFRPVVGFGAWSDVRVVVNVLDQETGEPVEGAAVGLVDVAARASSLVTDERGAVMLEFKQGTWTHHSWLLSRRTYYPGPVMVGATAPSHLFSTGTVNKRVEYRIHLIHDSFGYVRKQTTRGVVIRLRKAGGRGDNPF